jgi:hypothetical protein
MTFRLSSFRLGLAALASSGLLLQGAEAQDKPKSRAFEAPEPTSSEVTTNLLQLGAKRDGLKRLEDDLFKPLKTFSPEGPFENPMVSPSRPPLNPIRPDKRTLELIERRKNWVFMNPDEIMAGPSTAEMFHMPDYGSDGQEKKKLSPLEQFYENLDHHGRNALPRNREKKDGPPGPNASPGSKEESDSQDDATLPVESTETERALKKLFKVDASHSARRSASSSSSLADVFGLGQAVVTPEEIEAKKARMDDFKKLLGINPTPAGPLDSLNPLNGGLESTRNLVSPPTVPSSLPSVSHQPAATSVQLGTINPFHSPGALPEVSSKAFTLPSTATPLPKPAPKVTPPIPTFTMPNRAF